MADISGKGNKLWLKIASVLLTLLLWFYVMNQGGLESGGRAIEVPLQYNNVSDELNVSGPDKVSVKLWGTTLQTDEIVTYVDLAGFDKGVYQVPVQLGSIKGAILTSVQPSKVEVTLEALNERVIEIKHVVAQNPPPGYQVSQVVLSTDRCLIKGDAAAVAAVATVTAPVELANVRDIAMLKSELQARDAEGRTITKNIELIPDIISAYVVVEKEWFSKKADISPQFNGTIAEGFVVGEVIIEPVQVTLLGDKNLVESLNGISTQSIDISGKAGSFTQITELVVPEGVMVVPSRVAIQVTINNIEIDNNQENVENDVVRP